MMGMSETEFYATTPRYFYNRLQGWRKLNDIEENRHRWQMEVQRALLSYTFNINADKIHRKRPAEIFPLPWDPKPKTYTKEEILTDLKNKEKLEIPIEKF